MMDFLFRRVEPEKRSQLLADDVALYSVTDQLTADEITADIAAFVPEYAILTDATACVGGNTYSFAQYFQKVQAFEMCETRFQMLRHNLNVLGMENVVFFQGDAAELCLRYTQDIVFLDPPWGGPGYKRSTKIILYLSGMHLAEFCSKIAGATKFIALKVPTNFDETDFMVRTAGFLKLRKKNSTLRKMYLYIFEVIDYTTETVGN